MGRTPDPHTPLPVPGETGSGTMSHQHTALTGLPGGRRSDDTLLLPVTGLPSVAAIFIESISCDSFSRLTDNKQNFSSPIIVTQN